MMFKRYAYWLTIGVGITAAACSTLEPRELSLQLAAAKSEVEAAERADARTLAAENLHHAQDALAIAGDALQGKEYERSQFFTRKASLYARLAKAQSGQKYNEEKLAGARAQLAALSRQTDPVLKAPVVAAASLGATTTASLFPSVTTTATATTVGSATATLTATPAVAVSPTATATAEVRP